MTSLYAAIDLGSNSFHMLLVKKIDNSIQVIDRIKRKVRLAAGLDKQQNLSTEAMQRGWYCLTLFAEKLRYLPPSHIRIVATATLRFAKNSSVFIHRAEQILGRPIQILSGKEEAFLIYQGVTHTTNGAEKRLVVDIGGGSTELIVGQHANAHCLHSLPMGCVTWLERYFKNHHLNNENFTLAETAAYELIAPIIPELNQYQWEICVGASGTFQALQEIMLAQETDEQITLDKLLELKQQTLQYTTIDDLAITGLMAERVPVFPSGLTILIALFRALNIKNIVLAGGALREGLIYSLLPSTDSVNIRYQAIQQLQKSYGIDQQQAERVSQLALALFQQLSPQKASMKQSQAEEMLYFASQLHEAGLHINLKQAAHHAAYLITHSDLLGFTPSQKRLLAALISNQTGKPEPDSFNQQNTLPLNTVTLLCRLLRLAIIFTHCRTDRAIPEITITRQQSLLSILLPAGWLQQHPLLQELLLQEQDWQQQVGWSIAINERDPMDC